jgi:hypothetical protein
MAGDAANSVSSAGDINGDGYDDLIVGAYVTDVGGINSGGTYVIFGAAGGFAPAIDLGALDGANGFRLDGVESAALTGESVSSAGDVNGDGYDDLIIAAQAVDTDGVSTGAAYVIFGSAGGYSSAIDLSTLDSSMGFRGRRGAV